MDDFNTIMTSLEGAADFFIVRHGESEGNVEGSMQGLLDRDLTDLGLEQAVRTAAWFAAGDRVDRLFTSPLTRAHHTARLLAEHGNMPAPEVLDSLVELDTGRFTGLSFDQIRSQYPEDYAEFIARSWETVPDAESVSSLLTRSLAAWRTMVDAANDALNGHGPPRIVAVTHGGTIQWLLKASFGATLERPMPWMPLILASNAALFHLTARPVRTTGRDGAPIEWYYAQWSLVNRVPGAEDATPRDQFHTDARGAGDQAR